MAGGLRTGWIVVATAMALLSLSAALFAAFTNSTRLADDLARGDERALVKRYLARATANGVLAQKSQLTWDEAVRHAGTKVDAEWTDVEYGRFYWESFRINTTYLVSADGSLLRAWHHGKPVPSQAYGAIRWQVESLIKQSLQDNHVLSDAAGHVPLQRRDGAGDISWPVGADGVPLSRWAGSVVEHDGHPTLMTVAAIVPDRTASLLKVQPNYIVALEHIDGRLMKRMGQDLLMPDIRYSPGQSFDPAVNEIALHFPEGGDFGWLQWTAKTPGPTIIRRTAPLLATWIMFFLGVVAGGVILLRRARRVAHDLQASEAQAQHNALHDAMSGLPNRAHFMQRLRSDLFDTIAGRARGDVFVAYLDIDLFKVVNDTLGHRVGDELVRQLALRLRRSLPVGDFISRFGGDEFVILRRAEGGRAAADAFGMQLMAMMREPFSISGNTLDITCSCGISWGPEQSEDPGELLRRADIALYRAKQRGRARFRRFTRDMDASVKLRREMETELRRAIVRDELAVAFQPIVDMASGQISGFEALLRWPHPERGDIRPGLFVPIAEQGGLMVPLGNWMLRRVFTECRDWPACDISVNLSPLQIMASDFLQTMAQIVAETGIDPARVVLEVTEGIMLDRSEHVFGVLRDLNKMGFRIALDDFGIGYSSLSYLRSFQFDRIKIDRSFVQNIEGDTDAHSILCAIVSLGHTLRMKVVAEGVETESQRRLVAAAGCELVQGHLFWMAMPVAQARALLEPEAIRLRRAG